AGTCGVYCAAVAGSLCVTVSVVVCPSDESAAKIRCEFCNHCPSIHGRITDLGDTEQGLTVPPILPIVGTGINEPSEVQQPYHPDCSKDHEREVAEVLQESAQPGCSKDGSLWVEAPPPSDLPVDMSQQLAINEAPAPSKPAPKVFCDWLLANMPEFSDCVQPILKGKAVSEKSQTKLSRQLRAEMTLFLDEHDLITTGNKGERRSMYKALGEALATKYPLLLWDEPKPESHLVDKRTHVYSLFIRRLTVARKVRKHRKMRSAAAVTPSMPTPALTKESAVAELEALRSADLSTVALDIERMKCLLEVTYEDRCKRHNDPLPQYFLLESILCIEVELRFKCKVGDLEKKVKAVVEAFSHKEERECTFVDIGKHLQSHSRHTLINENAMPNNLQVTAPHVYIYCAERTCVYAGSTEEVIWISGGNLERALIFCLLTYYIKNLDYPPAFSTVLVLLQKITLPDTKVPRGLLTNRLKNLLIMLKKNNLC
ncbi:unnamed protein product, partial [Ixodes persulcatus]